MRRTMRARPRADAVVVGAHAGAPQPQGRGEQRWSSCSGLLKMVLIWASAKRGQGPQSTRPITDSKSGLEMPSGSCPTPMTT